MLPLFPRQLEEYITLFSLCQYFFETFFKFFRIDFFVAPSLLAWEPVYITTSFRLCQQFFDKKFGYFADTPPFLYTAPCVFGDYLVLYTIYCASVHFISVNSICRCRERSWPFRPFFLYIRKERTYPDYFKKVFLRFLLIVIYYVTRNGQDRSLQNTV